MTMAPVRPIFQNGQRLTAERLTEALEFLRTMIRRVLLAPLSAGVAAGFEFDPPLGQRAAVLEMTPGLAIDGKGRLLVVPEAHRFTAQEIAAAAGVGTPSDGVIVRVCLALDDSSLDTDPCAPYRPLEVEEATRFLFIRETLSSAAAQFFAQFAEPNCVDAWANLDELSPPNSGCCVTLGHVFFKSATELEATCFFRQGVSPRFNVIRNTNGVPSIFMGEARIDLAGLGFPGQPVLEESGVGIPVTTIFGPKPVAFTGPALFTLAGGLNVQATHLQRFGTPNIAATVSPGDPRVAEFAGGAAAALGGNEIGSGLAGLAAVPSALVAGSVTRAGFPLWLDDTSPAGGNQVRVQRPNDANPTNKRLIGLSAGPSYAGPSGLTVVPVALGGVVQVQVEIPPGAKVEAGDALTIQNSIFGTLRLATALGERILARAAQFFDNSAGVTPVTQVMYAWAVQPADLA
jgi:hypothetical protein